MIKYTLFEFIKATLFFVVSVSIVIVLAVTYVDDGNIWGIYITDGHLVVGDFWAGMIITYLLWNSLQSVKDIWFWGKALKDEIQR